MRLWVGWIWFRRHLIFGYQALKIRSHSLTRVGCHCPPIVALPCRGFYHKHHSPPRLGDNSFMRPRMTPVLNESFGLSKHSKLSLPAYTTGQAIQTQRGSNLLMHNDGGDSWINRGCKEIDLSVQDGSGVFLRMWDCNISTVLIDIGQGLEPGSAGKGRSFLFDIWKFHRRR